MNVEEYKWIFFLIYDLKIVILPLIVSILAQILKTIIDTIRYKKFSTKYFLSSWWFPSIHSTIITSIVVIIYMYYWVGVLFSFSLIVSLLVFYDAINIRYQAWKQAEMLKFISEELDKKHNTNKYKTKLLEYWIKERLGHTKLEVLWWIFFWFIFTYMFFHIWRWFFSIML